MLIEFYGRNFGCFRDEFRLSMLATDIDPDSNRGIVNVQVDGDQEPLRLLRAVALYGPNASGKSTVLRAAGALSELLRITSRLSSDSALPMYEPFALGGKSREPVTLGAKAVIEGSVYDYEVSYTGKVFVSERLTRLRTVGEPEVLVDRSSQEVSGAWTKDPQFSLVSSDFRPNALLLSLADSLAPSLAKQIAVGLRRLLRHSDPLSNPLGLGARAAIDVAQRARDDEALGAWLLARLKAADVGVVKMQHKELKPRPSDDILEFMQRRLVEENAADEEELPTKQRRSPVQLSLLHDGEAGPVPLPYGRESLGTKRLVEWSPLLYQLIHSSHPSAAFIDEFDASMHPLLFRTIIANFNCELPPEARGQLIFATHETTLLDAEAKNSVLRRDQVYLTEKEQHGAARLFSIAEFQERNNLNMRRRYLQGRYGALPSLGELPE
jgi:uncharacterized protein